MAVGLIVIISGFSAALYFWVENRHQTYNQKAIAPLVELAVEGWNLRPLDERNIWLNLVSSLTNSDWQVESRELLVPFRVEPSRWTDDQFEVFVRLDTETAAHVTVTNLADWHTGYGWVLLNAVSQQVANQRQRYFDSVLKKSPWPIDQLERNELELASLTRRQLSAGQAVLVSINDGLSNILYVPVGQTKLIRIGPLDNFIALPFGKLVVLLAAVLITLVGVLVFMIRPIQTRINAINKGVEAFSLGRESINLPTDYQDNLGNMARRVETMANGLVRQIKQNEQLNQAVSHDLKTPLARLRFAHAMLMKKPSEELHEQIKSDIDLLVDLTNELLLYHELSSTQMQNLIEVDPVPILRQVISSSKKENDRISLNVKTSIERVCIESAHLRRLAYNLINNALQYGSGLVQVDFWSDDKNISLEVSDDGQGVTPDQLEKFVIPFQRAETSRNLTQNNHGLGLSIVYALCQHYRGHLTTEESQLGGASIRITLPLNIENYQENEMGSANEN
jgi:signal transduction histidine kinase